MNLDDFEQKEGILTPELPPREDEPAPKPEVPIYKSKNIPEVPDNSQEEDPDMTPKEVPNN